MNTLNEFKKVATLSHDNSEIASKNWSKTWGLTYWADVWFYKEYTYKNLKLRTGQVIQRHTKQNVTKFYLDNNEISKKEFFKHISSIEYQVDIQPITMKPKQVHIQLSLF